MPSAGNFTLTPVSGEAEMRLDAFVAGRLAQLSRSQAAMLIRSGAVVVNGIRRKPGYKIKTGETVSGVVPEAAAPEHLAPEAIELQILFEDHFLIVVNKPAGMVVHPAAGHFSGTLVNALLHHCPDLEGIGGEKRPGIVHRLDKDTSGVLVVAKNDLAHGALSAQFKNRQVRKTYLAAVHGEIADDAGCIDLPIGRHPSDRKKMSTYSRRGREALTLWRVKERYSRHAALLEIDLKTGRTHQIRVHCAAMGHPVIKDAVYGRPKAKGSGLNSEKDTALAIALITVRRQMLHAFRIRITHPFYNNVLTFEAPVPQDMERLLAALRNHAATLA